MMVKYYQSHGNNDTGIGRRYVNAVETRNRVALSLLSEIVGHLEKLITAYQRLMAVLDVDLLEHNTSVPGQIYASINTIVQQTHNSLEEFNSQIVQKFTDYYEQNVELLVTQLDTSAKSILSSQFSFTNTSATNTYSFNTSSNEKMFDYEDAFCKDLDAVNDKSKQGANFSTKLFLDRTCSDLDHCWNRLEHGRLTRNGEVMTALAKEALECLPVYRTFLDDVQSWMKRALTMNSSLPLQPANRRYVLKALENEINVLKNMSRAFAENSMVMAISTN